MIIPILSLFHNNHLKQSNKSFGYSEIQELNDKTTHLIEPYFFENADDESFNVDGDSYRHMIIYVAWIHEYWSIVSNFTNYIIDLLRQKFPGPIISEKGSVKWIARWYDLTLLVYFFGVIWESRFWRIIHNRFLNSRMKFFVPLMRKGRNYIEMSLKISAEESMSVER